MSRYSGRKFGHPIGIPEYPDIYPEYPMKRCSNVFPRDLWLATCDHVAAIQHIFLLLVTTGKPTYAECQVLCRVQNLKHSAKELFVECPPKSTRWTTGTQRNKSLPSAGQLALGKDTLCRVSQAKHSTKHNSTCTAHVTAGARPLMFVKCQSGGTRQTCAFAECP